VDTRNQVKQYIDIAWRRKWWVVVPLVAGTVISLYLYWSLPKLYRAATTILVIRQSVPDDIVRSAVTMRIEERMKSLKIQVLSRTYLEKVAREIGLIDDTADEARKERVCDQLNASVQLDWDKRDNSWFRIMVHDRDPERAAKVANRLAEMFIDQNSQSRSNQASALVSQFDVWLQSAESKLETRDHEISQFKTQNLYELPEQEQSALQLMSTSQNRVTQLSSDIQVKSDRLSILRSDEKAKRLAAAASGLNVLGDDPDSRALAQLERELNDLLVSYTDENPLVRRKRDQIAQFKTLHPTVAVAKASGEPQESPEVRRLELEVRSLEKDRDREVARVEEQRQRIAKMPARAQELAGLTRDYEMLKKEYDRTVGQKSEAMRSFDLEQAKKGEQFQIQDAARPSARPYEPQLFQLLLMGLATGLGVGVGMAALLEFLDQSVRGEEQFADLFPDVPILGSIPNLIASAPVKPHAKKSRVKKAAAGAVALLAVLGGFFA
jgi:polysaccharide chain length determinant protein (PEP-CTERM system associated)